MARMDKVNEFIKREISNIIMTDLQDPRLKFVTITAVTVSRDLHTARVSFSVLGEEKQRAQAHQGLMSARGLIRKLIGQRMSLRYTPQLEFVHDRSLEYSARIEETLKEIHDEFQKDH